MNEEAQAAFAAKRLDDELDKYIAKSVFNSLHHSSDLTMAIERLVAFYVEQNIRSILDRHLKDLRTGFRGSTLPY